MTEPSYTPTERERERMDVKKNKVSVVMLPWLAYGHTSPFLELAKKLTERNFHIYLCSTPIILNSVKKKLDHDNKHSPSIQLVEFHLPSLPDLPPHYHTTNGLPSHLMNTLKNALDEAAPSFSSILDTLKPDLVLYDFNQGWAPAIASSLGIPAVQFHTNGATMVSYALHHVKNPGKPYPFPEIHLRNFKRSVGLHMNEASSDQMKKDVCRFSEALSRSCNIVLSKSFREIEGEAIDYLSDLAEKKVIPVGPLVGEPVNDEVDDDNNGIIQWLDKKGESSTVFVSFGSECFLTKDEIEEVAYGLELSKVDFIWAIRFSLGEKLRVNDVLPEGFLDRLGGRGMIVEGWAPQVKILGHSSIGGFVSHCGWSSVMESMKLGVPIIALPMQLDQPFNAKVVEKVGVGVEITIDENGRLQRQNIAEVIRKVVVDKDGEGVRFEARKFSDCIRMKKDKEIDEVVEELLQICS